MTHTIYINQQRYKIDPADLIESGGEGMVFGLGNTAVKLYHQPNPTQQEKLRHWFAADWSAQLPHNVLAPCAPVQDTQGQIIGLQMAKLPAASQPIKQLSKLYFWQQQGVTAQQVISLFQQLQQTLSHLHQLKIVVGDLNDTNIFLTLPANQPAQPFWIDVDSYQFAHFPCPVAMPAFLDPLLYHVTNFGKRPYFTPSTDWYAFTVLLVKSLLQVHPYGGVHRQHKSLQARATAKVSILDSDVNLPPRTRPLESLSDGLLDHLHHIFDLGDRWPFPLQLLQQYAQSLRTCSQCQLTYPTSRRSCPACRHRTPTPHPQKTGKWRTLLTVDGFIEAVFTQPNGRFLIIYRQGENYRLVRAGIGGSLSDVLLFSGTPGYRFGAFTRQDGHDFLVVNPPNRPQLLVLDIRNAQPQQVTMLETAMFRDTAVFATTPNHLFRISGGWIMRGTVRQDSYLEDTIGTAHQAQTQLFGSPFSNTIAGYHRIFAEYRFFTISPNGTERPLTSPSLTPNQHIVNAAVTFATHQIGVVQQVAGNGRSQTIVQTFNENGSWQQSWDLGEDKWETAVNHFPIPPGTTTSFPETLSPDDKLHHHASGWLLQQSNHLKFVARNWT